MKLFNNLEVIKNTRGAGADWWTHVTGHTLSVRFVSLIQYSKITPNQLTIASAIITLLASFAIFIEGKSYYIWAAIMIHVGYIMDCADGQLARYKNIFSPFGPWLDSITDRIKEASMIFAMTYRYSFENNTAYMWGFWTLFVVFLYHGSEISKLPMTDRKTKSEIAAKERGIIRFLLTVRRKLRLGLFFNGEQYFLICLFLVIKRLDLFFYIFPIYGTMMILIFHLNKFRQYFKYGKSGNTYIPPVKETVRDREG